MNNINELKTEELLFLKYIILRDSYNYSNNYIMSTKYDNLKNSLKIDFNYNDILKDISKYDKIIYKILINKVKDIYLDLLTEKEKNELIDLLDKLLYIFSVNKEESISKYNELRDYKINVFKRLKEYDLKEILLLLNNPLDNDELITKLTEQMNNKHLPDSRKIYLNLDKHPINNTLNIKDFIKVTRTILKDSLKYYLSINKNNDNYNLISNFVKENIKTILSDEAINIIKKEEYIDYFNTKDESIIKLLKFLQNEIINLKTDHYGTNKYTELVPENTKFFLNPTTERNSFNYDIRIIINTPDSKETYLFLNEYRKKCRNYNVEFNMKGITPGIDVNRKDNTILYSLIRDLPTRIRILNEIEIEHPEIINTFGTPLSTTSRIYDSYYGITKAGIYSIDNKRSEIYNFDMCKVHMSYSDYFDLIEKYAYYSNISRLIIENDKIYSYVDNKYKKSINNFAKLCNIEVCEPVGLINKYKTNNVLLENLVTYLRKYKFNELLIKENVSLESKDFIDRYKIRLQSLSNISEKRNINSKISITNSSFMYNYILK